MTGAERFRVLTCTDGVRSDLRGKSVRAAAVTGITSAADFVIRIGSTAVLTRLLVPEAFGLVMMVMAVTAIAEQLRELGLSAATVQRKDITHAQVSNLFWINTGIGALLAVVVCAISPLIAAYYREPRLIAITCMLASNFFFGGMMVQHQALLTRQMKLGHTAAVRLGASILSTLLAIGLAWGGWSYWALVWREIVRAILLTIGMWCCFPWTPALPSRKSDVRDMLGFGANLSVANIVGSATAGTDRFFLGRLVGAGEVAIYRQAFQLITSTTDQLVGPLYNVAQPGLSLLQSEPKRFECYYRKVLLFVCLLTMPLSMFVAVYSHQIARVLLGPEWVACGPVLMILSFGTFIRQAAGSSAFVLITRGHSRRYLQFTLCHNLAYVVAMFIGAKWGFTGAAVADCLVIWLMLLPRLYFSLKDSPVSLRSFFSTTSRPALVSITMAAGLWFLNHTSGFASAFASLVAGALAAPLLFAAAWLVLPGGAAAFRDFLADAKSIFSRKKPSAGPLEPAVSAN